MRPTLGGISALKTLVCPPPGGVYSGALVHICLALLIRESRRFSTLGHTIVRHRLYTDSAHAQRYDGRCTARWRWRSASSAQASRRGRVTHIGCLLCSKTRRCIVSPPRLILGAAMRLAVGVHRVSLPLNTLKRTCSSPQLANIL